MLVRAVMFSSTNFGVLQCAALLHRLRDGCHNTTTAKRTDAKDISVNVGCYLVFTAIFGDRALAISPWLSILWQEDPLQVDRHTGVSLVRMPTDLELQA